MGGWWPEASGRMRGGFFVEGVSASKDVRRLEYMNGWFMSYRREVFDKVRFDENLSGYAWKEDIDFSYRVSQLGYVLVQTPRARIDHRKSDVERFTPYDHQRMNLANQFYLHRKNMPQTFEEPCRALVGGHRHVHPQRGQGRAHARPRLPHRAGGRSLGAGARPGAHRPAAEQAEST